MSWYITGVYRIEKPDLHIDIYDISELHTIKKNNSSLTLGGSVTLTRAENTFIESSKDQGFQHLQHMANHVDLIASVPVRNVSKFKMFISFFIKYFLI